VTRAEHVQWARGRALAYLNRGDLLTAVTSMLSDMAKHRDTARVVSNHLRETGMARAFNRDPYAVRLWLFSFKE